MMDSDLDHNRSAMTLIVGVAAAVLSVFLGCTVRYGTAPVDGTPSDKIAWLDTELYPFESNFLEVPGGKLHFIDEGPREATPMVFVHGTPTWSFLYRDMIRDLSDEIRCVAADHIGFGLSSKPAGDDFDFTPQNHSQNLVRLLDELDLTNVTLVIHDLGGPIGIGAALARPERVARIVVVNSFAWSLADNDDVQSIDRLLRSAFGEWLYLKRNISPEFLLPGATSDDFEFSNAVHQHYTHPFADETTRSGLLAMGLGLAGESIWYGDLWAQREKLEPKIKLLVFGLDDAFFGPDAFEKWSSQFPKARAIGLEGVGHFVQEEVPFEFTAILKKLFQTGEAHENYADRETSSRSQRQSGPEASAVGATLQ